MQSSDQNQGRDINFYRNEVLDAHLLLEDNVNTLLEMAFRIKLPKSFSNNYNKLDLLLDLGLIKEDFRDSFQLFSRIRNNFIHVLGCLKFTDLPEKLRKQLLASQRISWDYLEDNENLFEAFKQLFENLMMNFMEKVEQAASRGYGEGKEAQELKQSLNDLINYICDKYPEEDPVQLKEKFNLL